MLLDSKVRYRVKADIGDWRDYVYQSSNSVVREYVDLREYASPVEDQGHLGSCTGQAVVGAYELLLNREMRNDFEDLSRLFVYYNARLMEGVTDEDVGAYMRDAVKSLKQYGVCKELLWPYHIKNFSVKPDDMCYQDAKHRTIKNYFRILQFSHILDALNREFPVVFSTQVYYSFDEVTPNSSIVMLPERGDIPVGGHAMCFVGYDMKKKTLIARNSFGSYWGDKGYCYIPFDYAQSEVMDAWVFDISLNKE